MRVSELMVPNPKVIRADDKTARAIEAMQKTGANLLPVVNSITGRRLQGGVTAQSIRDDCLGQGHDPTQCVVADHLRPLATLHAGEDLATALPRVQDALGPEGVVSVVSEAGELLGLILRADLALEVARATSGREVFGRTLVMELVWHCLQCGWVVLRQQALPEACPRCGAGKEDFVLVTED